MMSSGSDARTILITGGNKGIGQAIAQTFIAQGDRVAITYRSGEPLEGALSIQADVTDEDHMQKAVEQVESELGSVDVFIPNAGMTKDTLLMRMTVDDFSDVIDTNLVGVFRGVKNVITPMIKKRQGRIIFISSVSGFMGASGQANYSASKSALLGLARSISREVGNRNITANVIAPGFIETAMTEELSEKMQEQYLSNIPRGAFGRPEDVAQTALWLASDQAQYITGALIPVDGGLSMGI